MNRYLSSNVVINKKMFLQAKAGNIKEAYFFERKLGQGGFGIVYKAKNKLTEKHVAIKAIYKSKIGDISGFVREY